uniref:Alpha2-macroglobulin n=1 Tax=Cristaria plicata TaxID=165446 RepID=B5ACH4_CRIPL|nr:alpha2-macroglobulin [Cristaria plicata]
MLTKLVLLLWMSCVKSEYLFTMPRSLRGGSQGKYCLTLRNLGHENPAGYNCQVSLQFLTSERSIREHIYAFHSTKSDWSECVNFDAPNKEDQYTASVTVHIDGKELFSHEKTVDVWTAKNITLIQTDKPQYKPGQTVKFRILRMDYRLLPLTDLFELITIDNPGGVRVMQWKNVDASKGLVSLEMKLSDDPVLGTWNIKVHGADETIQSFKVEEYVLPKFEVKITPPKYLLPTTKSIMGKVCADYTYGQPVKGSLTMKVCFGPEYYPSYYHEQPCVDIIETNFDGCHLFSISPSQLKLGKQGYPTWGSLKISATVRETATGIELNGTSTGPPLTNDPLKIEISDESDGYFKPGFPYKGKVTVTLPDGNPASNEVIRIKAEKYSLQYYWSREFTTDSSGIINFSLSNLGRDAYSLSLTATAVNYEKQTEMGSGLRVFTPNGYRTITQWFSTITQWFSPSLSYIYIPTIKENVPCDSIVDLDVIYSTDGSSVNVFKFVVKYGDDVAYVETKEVTFDGVDAGLDILQVNPAEELEFHKKVTEATRPLVASTPEPEPAIEEEIVPEVYTPLVGGGDEGDEDDDGAEVQEELIVPEVFNPLGLNDETKGGKNLKKRSSEVAIESKEKGHFKMPISINTSRSEVTVLVYYIRQDKEVVAASLIIPVEGCFKNKVKMEFVSAKARPGEAAAFNLYASPNSLCSVGMVDKSVNLLGGEHQLTPKKVFDEVRKVRSDNYYHSYWLNDRQYCKEKNIKAAESISEYLDDFSYGHPQTKDSIEAFRSSKMIVFTDAVLETRPCSKPSPFIYPLEIRTDTRGLDLEMIVFKSDISLNEVDSDSAAVKPEPTFVRSYFPETWLWELHILGDDGVLSVKTEVPHTITEWVGNTLCSNSKDGVGVSPVIGITVFQPFFLSFNLPYSAIRGENLLVLVTVFNYMTECLTMEVRIKETDDFRIQSPSVAVKKMCVCGGDSKSAKFHIVPLKVGEIDLEATAVSMDDDKTCVNQIISKEGIGVRDGVRRKLLVEPEGIPQEYTKSFYLCPEGSSLNQVIDLPAAGNDELVPDSTRVKVNVIGDIMGPTLSNLKDLLKMPYGCGEQNMASWSPNIYVLQYLTNTNQLTDAIQDEAKGYMRIGYQRQLKYRHHDGSYSAWGDNEYQNSTGSTWLTAFVVKSMAQSRIFIDIDSKDLDFSMQWLLNHQSKDGCIQSVGQVFSNYLKGGLGDGENVGGLTAFALIALLEAGIDKNVPAVTNGFTCLDKQQTNADTYTLAVMAYAYTLYNVDSPKRVQIMAELEARAKMPNQGQKHWSQEEKEADKTDKGYFYWRAPSAEVEMTAYVLMAKIALEQTGAVSQAQPIVQWLTQQRNAYGGFSSTQDTVVALQALSMYATLVYHGGMDISVKVDMPNSIYQTGINDSNSLVLTTWDLPPQTTQLSVNVQGKGCAMVQANMKYNIKEKKEKEGPTSFHVRVNLYRSRSDIDNCKKRTLRICVRYALSNVSNMAIVEVKMVSGWIPVKSSVKELEATKQIQKFEINPDNVDFYFDEFDSQERCFAFEVEQSDIEVSNPKPALITVYDYYEIKHSLMILYEIKTICGTKEELPFPELWEPYWRFYDDNSQRRLPSEEPGSAPGPVLTCPVCTEAVDASSEDFKMMVCQAEAVYKATVGRSGKYSMKIMTNFTNEGKRQLEIYVNEVMGSQCQCSVLSDTENKALILTPLSLLDTEAKELTLDDRSTLIHWSDLVEKSIHKIVTKQGSAC